MTLIESSVEFSCEAGRLEDERQTGPVYRVSLDECKEKFLSVGKAFVYYGGSNHCQEVRYDIDDDSISSNPDWKTCIATSKKQGKLLHKFQNI